MNDFNIDALLNKYKGLEVGAAYIRVSTDDQTELSPDAQLREILNTAKEDGFVIPQEFIFMEERGRSGRRADNRPEFQRMIGIAKQHNAFKRLYLWKFSRFARNQEESTFYKGILRRKCGVDIKSVSEPIIDGMFGRLIEMIIEWFDEYYSINLSGEVTRGMTEKALKEGYQTTPSLGYKSAGGGKPFVVDDDGYAIASFIHQSYYVGKDITQIARECNARGYRTRRGNRFDNRAIKIVLTNRFYIGEVKWKDIVFIGSHEIRKDIVDVFQANQDRLSKEFKPVHRREASACAHWLSGVLKCSVCGASLGYRRPTEKNPCASFQCWKYSKGLHKGSCTIASTIAEKSVIDSLKNILDTKQVNFTLEKRRGLSVSEERKIQDAINKIAIKEMRVKDAYENGIDTLDEYKQNKERLQGERKYLEEQLNTVNTESTKPDKQLMLRRIQEVYSILTDKNVGYEEKGNAIRRIVKAVEYDRPSNAFTFHYYV